MKRLTTLALAMLALAVMPALSRAEDHSTAAAQPAASEVAAQNAAHNEAKGHEEATPLAGTIAQSVAALVVFGVVFVVLKQKAWGPILQGLTDREAKIRSDLEAAEAARVEAQTALAEYKKQIADADSQVRERLASATKDAEGIATRIRDQAQKDAEDAKNRAMKEIEESRESAKREVESHAANISTMIAARILKRSINEQDQADLVRSSLEEMGRR